ncbi:MAG: hypothetical protein Q8Q08_00800 [Candidatus Omnitrophota bacterium]|nr:hypothetical protein [Candidatus Omnitrophota bacterium]
MKQFRVVLIIGIIEILIGSISLFIVFSSLILGTSAKPPGILLFIVAAACISTLIGIGILKFKKAAYNVLLYFSSVIFLSKILIFMDIIQLNDAVGTSIPGHVKDAISMAYHGFVIYYLKKDDIRKIFHLHVD